MPGGYKNIKGTDGNTFKKGEITNPKGRPKGGKNVATMLKKLLSAIDKKNDGDGDYGNPLATELIRFAFATYPVDHKKAGQYIYSESTRLKALNDTIDRLDGKSAQTTELNITEIDKPKLPTNFRELYKLKYGHYPDEKQD